MSKKIIVIIISLLLIIIAFSWNFSRKEYIDDNTFYYPFISDQDATRYISTKEPTRYPLPWIYNGLPQHLLYRTLFLAEANLLDMTPDLASQPAEIIESGLVYRISLKRGQKWSDGSEITMEDLVYSIETVQIADNASHMYKRAFALIDSMEVVGNELTIYMKEKTTMLLPMLAQLVILPKAHLASYPNQAELHKADYFDLPISSGMYYIEEIEQQEYIKLSRNPHYTGELKPKIETVMLINFDKNVAKQDYYFTNNIAEMVNFRAMRGYAEHTVDMLFYRYFVYNIEGADGVKNTAMQDIRVRQAIAMAIDRSTLLRNVYFNMGNIVNGAGIIDAKGPYDYNPTRAKELLDEAGYDFARPLRLGYYYSDATSMQFIDQARQHLEAVGFIVEAKKIAEDASILYGRNDADGSDNRQYDILLKGLASFQASEWYQEYASTHSLLTGIIGSKGEFDELIANVIGETNPVKHKALMDELLELEEELLYKFPLHTLGQSIYINTNKVQLPPNLKFSNYFYISNVDFTNWEIKKQ